MCVEATGKVRKGPIKAWKVFEKEGCILRGIYYDQGGKSWSPYRYTPYKYKVYYKSNAGPGFQAFLSKEEATTFAEWSYTVGTAVILPVVLYNWKKGKFDSYKTAIVAQQLYIPAPKKRKVKRGK